MNDGIKSAVIVTVMLTVMVGVSIVLAVGELDPEATKRFLECVGARHGR